MRRVRVAVTCLALLSLVLQACQSEPTTESPRASVAAAPKTPAASAFRNLGKRAESDS